ncbi:universal stress protein [Halosolutus amylolyticus]|uniref:Universal stress protein n=1 Tax=Halosolutus amylolyticus TaxID=2932267 RepID=A0ABD5PUB7_9EURY|nr:universal stress protein [Halosolutus amylolyticus]
MPPDRLLLPVANPDTADRLLDTAIDVARDRALEILVLSVVTVPVQLSLEQARRELEIDDREALVDDVVGQARANGVDATGRIRFARNAATAICGVAEDDPVSTILLGWRGRPRRQDVILGSTIDAVLTDAPCDVLVERLDEGPAGVSSILAPVAGGPNTDLAAETAGSLAREREAHVELVTIVTDRDDDTVADARDLLASTESALGAVPSVERTVLSGPVVETIVDRTARHDVTVVGAAEGGFLRRVLVGSVPEAVARGADSTVIMARRNEPVSRALWRRARDRIRW